MQYSAECGALNATGGLASMNVGESVYVRVVGKFPIQLCAVCLD